MKLKKIYMSALAMGLMIPALSMNVLAADGTGQTPVTYDNRNYIPDPDNPTDPQWAVTIPSTINFTDDSKKIDASVKLVEQNGGSLPTGNVTVTVESSNNYKLKNGSDEVSYQLVYGNKTMSNTDKEVAVLNNTDTAKNGYAILGNDKAPSRGSYEDTLTYTISHT